MKILGKINRHNLAYQVDSKEHFKKRTYCIIDNYIILYYRKSRMFFISSTKYCMSHIRKKILNIRFVPFGYTKLVIIVNY